MAKTIFEEMGGTYARQGDYERPVVTLPPEEEIHVGIWGQRYKQWLKGNHCVLYYNLLISGKLNEQTAEVDEQAENLFSRLVQEIAEREDITESLKVKDMMEWV